jgi:hypothetical protein
MAHSVFEVDTFIEVPPIRVRSFLSTLDNQMQIHPLITQIQQTEITDRPDGLKVNHYRIRDRMKLGPFTIRFTYRVEMIVKPTGEIVSDAYQSPGIHLQNTTWCMAEGSGTRLRELVEIYAPGLLIQTVHQNGLAAHKKMFANLKKILEDTHVPA